MAKDVVKDEVPMDAYVQVNKALNRRIREIHDLEKQLRAAKVDERRLRGELARLEEQAPPALL